MCVKDGEDGEKAGKNYTNMLTVFMDGRFMVTLKNVENKHVLSFKRKNYQVAGWVVGLVGGLMGWLVGWLVG